MEELMDRPLSEDLGFLLSRASGAVVRTTNAALVEHGLRVRQYSVLVLACETADGVRCVALATAAMLPRSASSRSSSSLLTSM